MVGEGKEMAEWTWFWADGQGVNSEKTPEREGESKMKDT